MVDNSSLKNNFSAQDLSENQTTNGQTTTEKENNKEALTPKLLLVSMTILVAVSLIFAVGNWFDNLKIGFAIRGAVNQQAVNSSSFKDSNVVNALALQQKDTDLDGLSDYDELYIYKTSPYLPDSDSDGFSDSEEIKNNENPNCPAGQVCGTAITASPAPSLLGGLENLTADQIRQILIEEGGLSEEEVAQVDDQTLRTLYLETLQGMNNQEAGFSQLQPEQDLDTITPAQLRAILKTEEGINPEDVDALTDEELMQLWSELLGAEQ